MQLGGVAIGLLAESQMGRPIKLEGNPDHPASLGSTDSYSQASILNLYDPDRARTVTQAGLVTYEPFDFSRTARLPSGEEAKVGFSLAFTSHPDIESAGFFVCQQHAPEHFWRPEYQRHGNTAHSVEEVCLVADRPADFVGFLQAFAGGGQMVANPHGAGIVTARGRHVLREHPLRAALPRRAVVERDVDAAVVAINQMAGTRGAHPERMVVDVDVGRVDGGKRPAAVLRRQDGNAEDVDAAGVVGGDADLAEVRLDVLWPTPPDEDAATDDLVAILVPLEDRTRTDAKPLTDPCGNRHLPLCGHLRMRECNGTRLPR